ncbi:hypothetical protein KEM55_007800 [Ascosphaera atra]|nr:hypothetical protein KEM55_007800 [Ascosphaera atra]
MVKQALAPEGIQLPESLPSTAGDGHASSFRASSAKSGLGGSPSSSPGPFNPARAPRPATHTRQRTSSLVSKLMEEARKPERRPSLNFPIFKTPTLSSSPKRQSHISGEGSSRPGDGANVVAAHSQPPPTTLGNYLNSPADDRPKSREVPPYTTTPSEGARAREIPRLHRGATVGNVVTRPQTATSLGSRRTVSTDIPYAVAGASSSSTSAGSSRPKYSSSFGQRRSRLSLGGNSNPSNPEDEPALSRKASLVSLQQGQVPPSSAVGGHGLPEDAGFK